MKTHGYEWGIGIGIGILLFIVTISIADFLSHLDKLITLSELIFK